MSHSGAKKERAVSGRAKTSACEETHSARRKSSMSRPSGSVLKGLPLMRSMGGSSLCSALAITDFPVPRPPAMTTPPMSGFTAARSSAVLIGVWWHHMRAHLADDERHRESLLAHATLLVLRLGQRLVHSRCDSAQHIRGPGPARYQTTRAPYRHGPQLTRSRPWKASRAGQVHSTREQQKHNVFGLGLHKLCTSNVKCLIRIVPLRGRKGYLGGGSQACGARKTMSRVREQPSTSSKRTNPRKRVADGHNSQDSNHQCAQAPLAGPVSYTHLRAHETEADL
eukprot:1513352-Rhodomonas_salina.4